jgi:hypothetical protein
MGSGKERKGKGAGVGVGVEKGIEIETGKGTEIGGVAVVRGAGIVEVGGRDVVSKSTQA